MVHQGHISGNQYPRQNDSHVSKTLFRDWLSNKKRYHYNKTADSKNG